MHLVRAKRLGIPQESREAFDILEAAGLLDGDLTLRMKRVVGFRKVAVHEYRKIDMEIVRSLTIGSTIFWRSGARR